MACIKLCARFFFSIASMPTPPSVEPALRAWIVERVKGHDASHDIGHIDATVRHVKRIVSGWQGEELREAAVLAALAHELCDAKYVDRPHQSLSELGTFLAPLATGDVQRLVLRVVPHISFSKRLARGGAAPDELLPDELLVYHAVSDADMLEAMGATGVVRTFVYQAVHGGADAGKAWRGAADHLTEKLVLCADFMASHYAQQEARLRLARMRRIVRELAEERAL